VIKSAAATAAKEVTLDAGLTAKLPVTDVKVHPALVVHVSFIHSLSSSSTTPVFLHVEDVADSQAAEPEASSPPLHVLSSTVHPSGGNE
jgi:hypothetical protein